MKINKAQNCLNKIKEICFKNIDFLSPEEQIAKSDTLQYGFRYNAGQKPILDNEYTDYRPLARLLLTADNTDLKTKQTNFPDFECDNGIIEHFRVTATNENKKGSKSCKVDNDINSEIEKEIKEDLETGVLEGRYEKEHVYSTQTFDFFVKSFKKNWEKHIESLNKYDGNTENVCFLIESDCFGLKMERDNSINHSLGIKTGRIVENYIGDGKECFNSILLGRCKELLEYVYTFKDKV